MDKNANSAYPVYLLVPWPDSQEYMEEDWFEEEADASPTLAGAYYIPQDRVKPD